MQNRLTTRGRDSSQEIHKRLNKAQEEMSHMSEYDHIVVNEDLDKALEQIKKIVTGKKNLK